MEKTHLISSCVQKRDRETANTFVSFKANDKGRAKTFCRLAKTTALTVHPNQKGGFSTKDSSQKDFI